MKLTTIVILAIFALCLIITEGRPHHERDGPEVKPELDKIQVFRDKSTRDILKRDAMKRLREKHFARFKNSRRPINGRDDDDDEDRIYTYREYSDSGCNGNIDFESTYRFKVCFWRSQANKEKVDEEENGIITVKSYDNPGCFGKGTNAKNYTKNVCTYDADKQKYVKWTW